MENKKLEKSEGQQPSAPAPEQKTTPEATPAPQPKLAQGLFGGFALGASLKQGPNGNVMTNMKKPMMDYNKVYAGSTKNQKMTADELKAINPAPVKKQK